ncbi:9198_t:CDS:1, partial [Racocetra persica]
LVIMNEISWFVFCKVLSSILCRSLGLDTKLKPIKNAVLRNKSKIDIFSLGPKLTIKSSAGIISIVSSEAGGGGFDFHIVIMNFTISGCLPIG